MVSLDPFDTALGESPLNSLAFEASGEGEWSVSASDGVRPIEDGEGRAIDEGEGPPMEDGEGPMEDLVQGLVFSV